MEIIAQEHKTFVLIEGKDNGWVITMPGEGECARAEAKSTWTTTKPASTTCCRFGFYS